ncbi:MAG TPA: hypothetical protein VGY97_13605, partial [Solirubrobacteraceae bacterium]|nr:hypothetical protein [Solirubrobacteraceae bacterium]
TRDKVRIAEIDLVGYSPLISHPSRPPLPGFQLVERRNFNGLVVFRFQAARPEILSEHQLAAHHLVHVPGTQVLAPPAVQVPRGITKAATAA